MDKKHLPIDVTDQYGPSFVAWWNSIQPSWRVQPAGDRSRTCPASEDWTTLRKGGSSGLYIVLVALSWWVRTLDPNNGESLAWNIVADFGWVLEQIGKVQGQPVNCKRSQNEESSSSSKKRLDFFSC